MAKPLGPPRRLLFVGDSLTYNNDLDQQVLELARAADPVDAAALVVDRAVRGGAPLKVLWKKSDARKMIANGKYDVVILQEDLPETSVHFFQEYAQKFHEHCEAVGSKLLLLMTWPYKRLSWIWYEGIAEAHRDVAAKLGCPVAPAGLAWQRAQASHPEIELYAEDHEHPSLAGTYLAAAVVFASLWKRSPEGLSYTAGLGTSVAAALRAAAWAVCEQPAAAGEPAAAAPRDALVAAAFALLDADGDSFLSLVELSRFASFMCFPGSAAAWSDEFSGLCRQLGAEAPRGPSLEAFRRLVDGASNTLLFSADCSDEDLQELIDALQNAAAPLPTLVAKPRRVVIVPGNGCEKVRRSNWYGWLADVLEAAGVQVGIKNMPDPMVARESVWLPFITNDLAGGVEALAETIVVGHSSGAAAAMRLAEKHRLGGMVLVSAYTSDLGIANEERSGYFRRPWQWEQQRANCGFIVQFASMDDPFLPPWTQHEVRDGLAPKVEYLEFEDRSHFFAQPFWDLVEVLEGKLGVRVR